MKAVKKKPYSRLPRITNEEVLDLFRAGQYRADLETGVVYHRNGEPVHTYRCGRKEMHGYTCFAVHKQGRRRRIGVHVAVWMAGNNCVPPEGWEVHHSSNGSNAFRNLYCLHPDDHRKLHGKFANIYQDREPGEDTPF